MVWPAVIPPADRVILWTHATWPNQEKDVQLIWQVASDADFANNVSLGNIAAKLEAGNTAKVDATGLSPDNTYFYRFRDETSGYSSVGTTRTWPSASATSVKFAVFSCTLYSAGFFNVYDSRADPQSRCVKPSGEAAKPVSVLSACLSRQFSIF